MTPWRNGSKFLAMLFVVTLVCACGDDGEDGARVDPSTTPVYREPGPYPAGVTTMQLADGRAVEVWYPGLPGSESGRTRDAYQQTDPLPPLLASIVRQIVGPDTDLSFETPAYRDLPAAHTGPFPVVLYSHGFGAWRLINSTVMAGVASWGFVVASPDHLERGLAAVSSGTASPSLAKDQQVLRATLALVQTESVTGGRLAGLADTSRVGLIGHSAGGAAVLSLLDDPQVDTVIGYAPASQSAPASAKPTLLIAAERDFAVTPEAARRLFGQLPGPKRMLILGAAGHNTFTDFCDPIQKGTSLTQVARQAGFPIDERLLELGENGCKPEDLPPATAWRIIQHFTVAHLRSALGIDDPPVGLGPGVVDAFPGVQLDYVDESRTSLATPR